MIVAIEKDFNRVNIEGAVAKLAEYIMYGVRTSDGKVVNILDIPPALNGKRCGCVCPNPECGKPLIAKLGHGGKVPHFAHEASSGCAGSANESALHRLAKEIIEEELKTGNGRIVVPPIEISLDELGLDDIPYYVLSELPQKCEYRKATSLMYTNVSLEQWFSGFRPDVIIETLNCKCLIEICVTHPVDPPKVTKVEERGIPMLEINLKDFYENGACREELRELIITSATHKKWIVRPHKCEALEWGRKYYEGTSQIRQYRAKQAVKDEAARRRNQLFQSENYKAALKALDRKGADVFKTYLFYKETHEVPFYVNIPVGGEIIFKCDRRVWQGAIFNHFIYNRKPENKGLFVENIFRWMKKYQGFFEVDWSLVKGSNLLGNVVKTYLGYLENLGFLSDFNSYRKCYHIAARHTDTPPNKEYADALRAAIGRLGDKMFSPNVGEMIDEELKPYREDKRVQAQRAAEEWIAAKKAEEEAEAAARKEIEQRKNQERKEAQERAKAEEAEKEHRIRNQIQNEDYEQNDYIVLDENDRRWVRCTSCNKSFLSEEMQEYGGRNRMNKGTCQNCNRRS